MARSALALLLFLAFLLLSRFLRLAVEFDCASSTRERMWHEVLIFLRVGQSLRACSMEKRLYTLATSGARLEVIVSTIG